MLLLSSADYFKIKFFKKFFQEHYQNVNQFAIILSVVTWSKLSGTKVSASKERVKIKAVLSEENCAPPPSPQPQIESASMLTALYCVTMIQAEIHQLFQGRA